MSKFELLRPLLRSALMKEVVNEQDRTILTRKAVSLGMDADEFGLFLDALIISKKRIRRNKLLGKSNYDDFFELGGGFDKEFDKVFLTEEERTQKENKELNEVIMMLKKAFGS